MADATDVKINLSDEDLKKYQELAVKWSPVYQRLPIAAAEDVLKYMTHVEKLRGKLRMPSISGNSQFRPFDKRKASDADVDIVYRTIETFHANVIETFAPVDYVHLPIGYDSKYLGEALKKAPQAALIMAELCASRGQHIAQAAFTGERKEGGDTTADVCDGLLTIAEDEMTAGNISVANGNLYEMPELTYENCCDEIKKFVFSMDPYLRADKNFLFVPTEVVDMYNESYLLTHSDVPYNQEYDQPYVEGSNKRLTLVGLPQLAGTDIMFATCKKNLLYGTYLGSDKDFVDIIRVNHYEMSMCSDMWMGFQFRTLDKRVIKFIKIQKKATTPVTPPSGGGGDAQTGGESGSTPSTGNDAGGGSGNESAESKS